MLRHGVHLARHLARDASTIAKTRGRKLVSPEERERRLEICSFCEYGAERVRCAHPDCGCVKVARAAFEAMKCPADKW